MQSQKTQQGLNQHFPQQVSSFGNNYLFAGRRFDNETGMYYYRNRYYEPRSGQFVNRDPKGYIDGMNMHAYLQNNPVNLTDPMGLDFQFLGWKWGKPKGGGKGRTYAYYGIALECYCKNGAYYLRFLDAYVRMRIIINPKFRKDFEAIQKGKLIDAGGKKVSKTQISYIDKKGKAVNTTFGIYGHERRHVNSVKAVYNKALNFGGKLRKEINKMEKIPLTTKDNCFKELELKNNTWLTKLLGVLKGVIDEGAGHDTDDTTAQPEGGRPYKPDEKMPAPKKKFKTLGKGYHKYPLPQ